MSSIAFRASTGATVDPAATSIALSNPTGTANDDILIVAVAQRTTTTPPTHTAPSGWTQIGSTTTDNTLHVSMWWRRWQTGDPTSHTFTSTQSGRWAGAIAAYSGVHTTAAIHAQAFAIEDLVGVSNHTSPAITTTVATWLINVFSDFLGSTWTPPSGETEREDRQAAGDISVEFCDSNGDRTAGSQAGKTATASGATGTAVMAQIALEPAPAAGGGTGTRTSQARIFRSTQTAPNAGTIRDLTTAFGTTANATTSAQYAAAGTVTWRRWNPNSSTTTAQDPAGVSTAQGQGWRDTVAQNANESVIVNAGTWTVSTRLTKTGQTIVADIVVRVVAIVYRVNSSGDHQQEIGRVQMADTTLSTATLTLSGSFITTSDTTFAAGDKVQVECYVTPITAGIPTAPAAAVNVNFVVDETSANSGASLTAIPLYRIAYARSQAESIPTTETLARRMSYGRGLSESIPTTETLGRVKGANRSLSESIPLTDTMVRAMAYRRTNTESIPTTETLGRATAYNRSLSESIPLTDSLARRAAYGRTLSESIPTTESLTRIKGANRSLSESIPTTDTLTRIKAANRALSESIPTTETLARSVGVVRALSESLPLTDGLVRQVASNRTFTEAIPTTDALSRAASYSRSLSESIPLTDALARSMGYSRGLTEDLAVGGGGEAPVTPADIAAIANAVWDELTSEGRATDSYGALVAARLDAAVSSRSSAAAVAALGSPAQASALTTVQGLVDDLEARLTAARALLLDNLPRLDVAVSTRAAPADLAAGAQATIT